MPFRKRDLTLFSVEAIGRKDGSPVRLKREMVDRCDDLLGFTSMARATAFTGAIVARMIARGEIRTQGKLMSAQVVTGRLLDRLRQELSAGDARLEETRERG